MRAKLVLAISSLAVTSCRSANPPVASTPRESTATAIPVASAPPTTTAQRTPEPVDFTNVGLPLPDTDVCERNPDGTFKEPVPEGKYRGLLRNARCDQQKFLTMASVMKQLGVKECTFCHAPDPNNPKKALYAEPTHRKEVANFMLSTFIDGLRRLDGKPMTCRSCHGSSRPGLNDAASPNFLRTPRDKAFTQEWMNETMTAAFVERSGARLRCKTCHEGMAPARPGWNPKVILELASNSSGSIERVAGAR